MAPKKPSVAASAAAQILVRQSNRLRGLSPDGSSLPVRNKKLTFKSGLQEPISEESGSRPSIREEDYNRVPEHIGTINSIGIDENKIVNKSFTEEHSLGTPAEENRSTLQLFRNTSSSDTDDSFRSVNEFIDNIEVIIEENQDSLENIAVGPLENNSDLEEPKKEIIGISFEDPQITEQEKDSSEATKILNSPFIADIINDSEMPIDTFTVPKLKLPNPFSAAEHEDAEVWFENFCRIAESYKWEGEELVNHFSELLSGTARKWWKFRKTDNDDMSWEAIAADFLKTFCNIGDTSLVMEALLRRTHRSEEDFRKYFFDVFDLCDKVDHEMSDEQRIFYLLRGLDPTIVKQLKLQEVKSPKQLFSLAAKLFLQRKLNHLNRQQ